MGPISIPARDLLSKSWWTAVAAIGQIIASLVAGWAALEARHSASAAKEAVDVAKISLEESTVIARGSHRAFVALADNKVPNRLIEGDPVRAILSFKNVGTTLAYDVKFAFMIWMSDRLPARRRNAYTSG